MPKVSVKVELQIDVEPGENPVKIEQKIAEQGRRAGRELFCAVLQFLDERAVKGSGAAKQRLEPRWVATTFGRVRLHRYRVKGSEGSFHPLDQVFGLGQSEPSPALREMICDLSVRIPFRQVADIASRMSADQMTHLTAWRILRTEGKRVRDQDNRLVESVFELGEAPPEGTMSPDLVVVEADGTFLKAQHEIQNGEKIDRFEIKTGVFYTGKAKEGGRRHRRYRLVNKGCYATTADADTFGQALAAQGFWHVGLHKAKWVLCAHDGLDETGQTFKDWFPESIHQVDRWHLSERIWQVCGSDQRRHKKLKQMALSNPRGLAKGLKRGCYGVHADKGAELAGYLETIAPDIHGVNRLPRHLRRGKMNIISTSVVEKHQDLLVKRRMKRQGMRWSREGAEALLALQARRFCDRWPTTWGVVAGEVL